MALCWPSLILLICAILTYANASFTLTPEVTNFIPSCAQTCFISFLDSNFNTATCGTTPTLDCLCSHNTTTGYTVGEGAVQCIISEDNIGFCKGNDAQSTFQTLRYIFHGNTYCSQSLLFSLHLTCVLGKQTLSRILMLR
jgi:hypothetical protein